jgi:hypothetical protein
MKKIKEEKNVEFLVNIKYSLKDDNVVQTFEFTSSSKKNFVYLFDARFLFKRKIDKLIKDFLLDGYISRIDEENKIILE